MKKPDFKGWATRYNVRCSDRRTIKHGAFSDCDGQEVPLVWNHQHNDPSNVIGKGILHSMEEGVYVEGYLNDSDKAQTTKIALAHGDINALSIYANQLMQDGLTVCHGVIKEVSICIGGANPEAFIEEVLTHSDAEGAGAFIYGDVAPELIHSEDGEEEEDGETMQDVFDTLTEKQKTVVYALIGQALEEAGGGTVSHSDEEEDDDASDEETVQDVFNTLTDKQKTVVYALIGQALEDKQDVEHSDDYEGGNHSMKKNIFENRNESAVLSHSDCETIVAMAKSAQYGTLQHAMEAYLADNSDSLAHGIDQIETLFPEYKDVRGGAPEMITTDQGWVGKVLAKVHKSPISRIRTRQADVRSARAGMRGKGYTKGTQKAYGGNIALLHRTTDPQTVYVKSKLDRDDIVDITDFDVVQYMYNIDRMNLNEELATAIMIGDGREVGSEGKIDEAHIRPIFNDDELYAIHASVDIAAARAEMQGTNTNLHFGDNYVYAEAVIQALLYARENYKGTGTPEFYCAPHLVNVMLLARDRNGRRIYDKISDLAAALNVGEIITAEQFEGVTRVDSTGATKKLLGIMVNLADYSMGATKGGEITHFTDFDIDFNQEKSLLETRCSGALTRIKSAIVLEEPVAAPAAPVVDEPDPEDPDPNL